MIMKGIICHYDFVNRYGNLFVEIVFKRTTKCGQMYDNFIFIIVHSVGNQSNSHGRTIVSECKRMSGQP